MHKKKEGIYEVIVDETLIKVGDEFVWLCITTEPKDKTILGIRILYERSMLIAEHVIWLLVRNYGKRLASTDSGTAYPQACKLFKLEHQIYLSYEKSIVNRIIQYIEDRIECFDDYFPGKGIGLQTRKC